MLIGFNGKMGVGKSTAIEFLKQYADAEVINVKFAQPLYDMQEYIYARVSGAYDRPPTFIKDRKLLQWLGTEWGRDTISQSLWIDLWKKEVQMLQELRPRAIIVCDDVRFDNEAEVVKALGGKIVQIVSTRGQDRTVSGIANHTSEVGIKSEFIDYMIENDRTPEDFKNSLTYLFTVHLAVGTEAVA